MTTTRDDITTIILIRHAQSVWNTDESRLCGSTDVELTEQGARDTEILGRALAGKNLDAVYCTPLVRSVATARAIARHHDLEPVIVDDLREIDYGLWEGLSYDEIARQYPQLYREWMADPTDVRLPRGDTPREVADRAWSALLRIAHANRGRTVAVVAHKTVNRLLLCRALKIPIGRFRTAVRQNNLACSEIAFSGEAAKVMLLNDTSHIPHDPGPDS